jgi:hypothetical protein
LIRWPATLLAAFVVFYQAIIWCLCGFRLTRVIALSLVATMLVAIGFLPTLLPHNDFWASETNLSAVLTGLMGLAYIATLVTVGVQRRGGARGWTAIQSLAELAAATIPRPQFAPQSREGALYWMEWRRTGLILPAAVILTMLLILGPVLAFTGRGEKETIWAETWLATLPILLAFPIGMGFGKPDFWSLDLKLSPFLATRPITAGQLVAAKMKSAACTTLLAWSILLATSIACIDLFCDTEHWGDWWSALAILYSPLSRWMVPILALVAGVLITWSLLVSSIWLGYSGRAGLYYTLTSIGLAAFVSGFIFLVWWLDHPQSRGDTLVGLLRWLPWALAALVTVKTWCAAIWAQEVYKRGLVSNRSVVIYSLVWLLVTSCLLVLAWLMAPGIEWFRNLMLLAALCAIPSTAIAISPLAITWNRHR